MEHKGGGGGQGKYETVSRKMGQGTFLKVKIALINRLIHIGILKSCQHVSAIVGLHQGEVNKPKTVSLDNTPYSTYSLLI